MPKPDLDHVETWVFDLDNTLYPPAMRLFDQIELRMTAFIERTLGIGTEAANDLRRVYWDRHGTTLAGLMAEHDVEPMTFLHDVHDIDFSVLAPDPDLAARITALPGRRIVYTNGDAHYAGNVLAARGLGGVFDAVYGVEHAGFMPKPARAAFETVFAMDGLDPTRAAMFEDEARNLEAPHAMGLRTVHVAPDPLPRPFIHHHTDDLSAFLAGGR
ncbi:pyrimidine 5'-nucleotidase [Pseudaestuariivita atlantica]|uniref:HAD family hydrolase n=1 Tax=Pseudaestuariivita atlantica TaxID=1317121 RepID=A0A0L1JVV8_9RHOB|nr:pyrimidine 5'-nucleotidase [Pseudaestuariivita atlantica]KNG95513.1 HAD family hydrolase [Pseudaestuariivita atlantica]